MGSSSVKTTRRPSPPTSRRSSSFPDGNASVARLLVRSLIPDVAPGTTMEDVVAARFDYGKLDRDSSPVRLRLESTAVRVRHRGDPQGAEEVEVTYVRHGRAERARAGHCVLACYNAVIPYVCEELPEEQKRALSNALKSPLVYANVLIRNWTAFAELGARSIRCPRRLLRRHRSDDSDQHRRPPACAQSRRADRGAHVARSTGA